jgi:hypothetical protein
MDITHIDGVVAKHRDEQRSLSAVLLEIQSELKEYTVAKEATANG